MSSGTAPSFSLAQYEETKMRMKQLQLEQQRQKQQQAANVAATTTTPSIDSQESKDQAAASSSSSSSVTSRARTDRTQSRAASAGVARGAISSRDASGVTPSSLRSLANGAPTMSRTNSIRTTGSSTASSSSLNSSAASVAAASSVASSVPSASPSTRTRIPPPASTYSHLSPRHQSPAAAWTTQTDTSTLQHAIGVNQAIPSVHNVGARGRLAATNVTDDDYADDDFLQATAPFAVATSSTNTNINNPHQTSQPSTPKAEYHQQQHQLQHPHSHLTDPFQPIAIPVPSPPHESSLSLVDDGGTFASKLSALASSISSTAQGLGLKYSMDAKLKLLVHEVDSAHSASIRQANEMLNQVRHDWSTASLKLDDAKQRYDQELLRARTTLLDKQRKLDKLHAQSLSRATKEAESLLRGEYAEKSKRFEGIEKYNEAKLKQLEEQIRVQVKQQLQQDSKRSKQVEDTLQAQLTKLEESGARIIQEKDDDLSQLRTRMSELESRLKDSQQREKTWERKFERLASERTRGSDELNTVRVELAQSRQDNTSLLTKIERLQSETLASEQASTAQSSQLSNRILDLIAETEHLKAEQQAFKEAIEQMKSEREQDVSMMKHKHAHELDTIQTRITAVLHKKDDQIGVLKQKLQDQSQRMRDIERELVGI